MRFKNKMVDTNPLEFKLLRPERKHDTSGDYDSEFLDSFEAFSKLNKYYQTLNEKPYDVGAREDAGKDIYGDPSFYKDPNKSVLSDLEQLISLDTEYIARYSENNESELQGRLEKDNYARLIQRVPLYKKEDDDEHNKVVDAFSSLRKIQSSGKDVDSMMGYLQEKIKATQGTEYEWFGLLLQNNLHSEKYIQDLFSIYLRGAQTDFQNTLKDVDPKKVFKDSLEEAKKELEKESLDKEKADIWKKNIRPYYLALAEEVYQVEDKKSGEDKSQEEKDKDERRNERRARGMTH